MSRRKKAPITDLGELLDRLVKVTVNGVTKRMHPVEAELEVRVEKALNGDIRACSKFIKACVREGLLERSVGGGDDHEYRAVIPPDWDDDEFVGKYTRDGPPPWPGERDGLTAEERERRRALSKRRRRS